MHGPLRRKLFSDESLWVEQQPRVDEQKCVDLFESLCFWDEQVGGFPQSENLEPSSFGRNVKRWGGALIRVRQTHSHGCFTEWLCLRSSLSINTSIC